MVETVPFMGSGAAGCHAANLVGVDASSSSLQRWSLKLGEAARRSGREEVPGAIGSRQAAAPGMPGGPEPPGGHARWTLKLPGDRLVELL